jgi:glycosyltransferase involved in cell wall biosynthesis
MHGRLDLPELQPVFSAFPSLPLVSISDAQRRPAPYANWARTIYHGLPENLLTPRPVEPSYLAFLGRISPEKRLDRAITIAGRCGLPLKVAAKIDKIDHDHYESIRPLLAQSNVEYVGEIGDAEKSDFLSGALALIVSIDWPEPFGLVMVEAMACGTPVIAFNRGSVPEVVEDGVTGFIVEDETSAVAAVSRLPQLSRQLIRQRFEERFTAQRMAKEYLDVYRGLIKGGQARPRLVSA